MLDKVLAMEWVSRVLFLEAAICVTGKLSAYVGIISTCVLPS